MNGDLRPEPIDVGARGGAVSYRLAQRSLKRQLVWWWQLLDHPDDTRQPCWVERRKALSYMEAVLDRLEGTRERDPRPRRLPAGLDAVNED